MELTEKEKIVRFATEKYLREGFYKTSMDSIAKELQISKKTIYKNFSSKEELVEAVIASLMIRMKSNISGVLEGDKNAIEKVYGLLGIVSKVFYNFSEAWISDIKNHAFPLWVKIDEFRTKRLMKVFAAIIEQGQKEGLILDYPPEIMINIFISVIRSIINPDFYYIDKFSYNNALTISLEIIFNGILTKKGKTIFKNISQRVNHEKI